MPPRKKQVRNFKPKPKQPKQPKKAVGMVRPQNLWNGEVVRSLSLFPQKIKRTLNYVEDFTFTPNAGTSGWVFSANSLYDPDVTSTGHQPMGFDQIMVFYQYYCVVKSSIKVILRQNVAGDGNYTIGAALKVATSSSLGSSWYQEIESGNVEYSYLNAPPTAGSGASGATGQFEATADIGRYLNIPKPLDYADLKGTASSSPAKQVYYQVLGYSPDTITGDAVIGNAYIQFEAVFTSPILPSLSSVEFQQRMHEVNAAYEKRRVLGQMRASKPTSRAVSFESKDPWADPPVCMHAPLGVPNLPGNQPGDSGFHLICTCGCTGVCKEKQESK